MMDQEVFQNDGLRMSLMMLALALIIGAGGVRFVSLRFRQLSKYLALAGFTLMSLTAYFRPGGSDHLQTSIFAMLAAVSLFEIVTDYIKRQREEAQSDKISLDYVRKKMRKS